MAAGIHPFKAEPFFLDIRQSFGNGWPLEGARGLWGRWNREGGDGPPLLFRPVFSLCSAEALLDPAGLRLSVDDDKFSLTKLEKGSRRRGLVLRSGRLGVCEALKHSK